jgi:hypothetical protein
VREYPVEELVVAAWKILLIGKKRGGGRGGKTAFYDLIQKYDII